MLLTGWGVGVVKVGVAFCDDDGDEGVGGDGEVVVGGGGASEEGT